jgi:hypothetical protein
MVRLQYRYASVVLISLLLAVGAARADEAAPAVPLVPAAPTDSSPGASVPPGLGLSPEAPPAPPAPGGRAPSFGAPVQDRSTSFRINGRIFGWEAVGIGRTPDPAPEGYSGTALHVPALVAGRNPFWPGAGAALNFFYGNSIVTAYVSYYFNVKNQAYQGYENAFKEPSFGQAYLLVNPPSLGKLRLQFRVGAFSENYAGPGQWGWGIFGPLLSVRGYGETTYGTWDLTPDLHLTLTHGFLVVPGVPESFPRGDYQAWIETGVSSYVNHAHAGLSYKQYTFNLHYASDHGTDDRVYLDTFLGELPRDGRFDTYLLETRYQGDVWGQVGLSAGLYDFVHAASVGDGIWWGIDWTQGAREMINKFIGSGSHGNGKVLAISAEYDFSVSRILWAPRNFNGQSADLRVGIAALYHRTLATDDPLYQSASGYYLGLETEYRMTSLFSMTFQTYGESRDTNLGRYSVYSLNPGIMFHSDWWSTDRIQLIYSRRFYSAAADPNSAQPLDHHMIALGGTITF